MIVSWALTTCYCGVVYLKRTVIITYSTVNQSIHYYLHSDLETLTEKNEIGTNQLNIRY